MKCEYCDRKISKNTKFSVKEIKLCQTCFIEYIKGEIQLSDQVKTE
jgi:ribosome-binding protein aMBF1 (putative translation factor)